MAQDGDTRTRILDTAQALIQRLGANAMSYQHIADAVGIRKASVHHHFPTKEQLLEALLDRYSDYFLALVDRIVTADLRGEKKLARYVGLFEATLAQSEGEKACLCAMLGAELATIGSASVARVRGFYEANEARLERILVEGRKAGDLHFPGSGRAMAALIFALLEGAVLVARARGGTEHLKLVTDQLLRMVRRDA